jgi:hypothetical protein
MISCLKLEICTDVTILGADKNWMLLGVHIIYVRR